MFGFFGKQAIALFSETSEGRGKGRKERNDAGRVPSG
jgi:hypothetical protein